VTLEPDMKNAKKALYWIVGLLRKKKIPFQIMGGFAANIYGSQRPLADIDIDIPDEAFSLIIESVKPYIIFGPGRYRDKNWDLLLMTLCFEGQEIDICSSKIKIKDHRSGTWKKLSTNFTESVFVKVYGLTIPVVPMQDLVKYKKILHRRVDQSDVKFLSEKLKHESQSNKNQGVPSSKR